MKFGACIPHYGVPTSKKAVVDFCQLAEQLMFDSIWSTDHIAVSEKYPDPYGNIIESLTTLSFAAAKTERVKLGTSIIVLPMRNPVVFAKQAASLDFLSDGRLILGLGAGWMEDEFATLNADFKNRGKIMNEQIMLMKSLWTTEKPQFEGQFFKVTNAIFQPKPVAKNGPPIWIGGSSRSALKRVTRLADGWHPVGYSPSQISEGKKLLDSILQGKRKITISVRLPAEISETATSTYSQSSGEKAYMLGGKREAVISEVEKLEEAGVEHLVCYFGNKPYDFVASQAKLFANEIIPSFTH
jgi:probable F420-dependent oxidoreductase